MRILQVIHDFLPDHVGGSELYCYYLSRDLAKRHEVVVCFTEVDRSRADYEVDHLTVAGLECIRIINNHVYDGFQQTYTNPKMDAVFAEVLDAVQPDVVHLQHLLFHSINYVASAKARGIPIVCTLHDYWLTCANEGKRLQASGQLCEEVVPEDCGRCLATTREHTGITGAVAAAILRRALPGRDLLARLQPETKTMGAVALCEVALGRDRRRAAVSAVPSRLACRVPVAQPTMLSFAAGRVSSNGKTPVVATHLLVNDRVAWTHTFDRRSEADDWTAGEVRLEPEQSGFAKLAFVSELAEDSHHAHTQIAWSGVTTRASGPPPRSVQWLKQVYRRTASVLELPHRASRAEDVRTRLNAVLAACQDVDLFFSPSLFALDMMASAGLPADRIMHVPLGVPREVMGKNGRPSGAPFRFGYVGVIAPHKGVHVAVDAFRSLIERKSVSAELWLYGADRWHPEYASALRHRAAGVPVHFAGEFEHRQAAAVYDTLDALVVPSLWWENYPLTVVEAIVNGLPVIASDAGGLRELVRHGRNGLLVPRGDADALSEAMADIVSHRGAWSRLPRGFTDVQSIEQHAALIEDYYASVIGNLVPVSAAR